MSNTRSVGSPPGKAGDSVDALIAEFEVLDTVDAAAKKSDAEADRLIQEFEMMGDPDGHVQKADQTFLIESSFSPEPAISAAAAAATATATASTAADAAIEMTQHRVLRIVWDADGCAYNRTYSKALFFFMHEYMDRVRFINAAKMANEDQSVVKQRCRELLQEFLQKFRDEYRLKSESELDQIYNVLHSEGRECLILKLKELGLNEWCQQIIREKPLESVEWGTVALRVAELQSVDATIYFSHLRNNQSVNWLTQQYLAEIYALGENFYQCIFVSANLELSESFLGDKDVYDEVVLMVGSNRQSYQDDENCKWINSTGSIFKDLNDYLRVLLEIFEGKSVKMDMVTMADIQNRLLPGESASRILSKSRDHATYLWDEKKGTMLYVFCHRAAVVHKNAKMIMVQFIDDREDIISDLYKLFHRHPELLPAGLVLCLMKYDGRINYRHYVDGIGDIDYDYANSSKIMSALSEPTSPDGSRVIIDSVSSLLIDDNAEKFLAIREAEKKKEMSTSLMVGGSSSFFAQRDQYVVDSQSQSMTFGVTNK